MLGGDGSHSAPERKFTPIEQALVRRLMDDALDDLRYSFGNLLASNIAVESLQYNSQFAQAAATNELMIVAAFTISVGTNEATATLALPADTLLAQLGDANPTSTLAQAEGFMRSQLTRVPVDVSIRLSPATVRPRDVLELAVGDLIPLPHPQHRPLDVTVEGQPIARAALGSNGSRLACVVVETQENAG
jgi:flagellar motor switch protein FliM